MTAERGLLVSLDGPGGAGKTTLARGVAARLEASGVPVLVTREPSDTPLGNLAGCRTHQYRGLALACLVAADRYQHLEEVVRPALVQGHVVLCERYTPTSLALQVIDGVARDTVWEINRHADLPDLAVVVTAAADALAERVANRGPADRFERYPDSVARQCAYLRDAVDFLRALHVPVVELDTTTADPADLVARIVGEITWLRLAKSRAGGAQGHG